MLEGTKISCIKGFTHGGESKVLSEELFYNERYESFQVVCIDRVLNRRTSASSFQTNIPFLGFKSCCCCCSE